MKGNKEDCNRGFKTDCCCNCTHQLELMCHPMNGGGKFDKIKIGKGSIMDRLAWVCVGPELSEGKRAIFFDTEHGMCEMHNRYTNLLTPSKHGK